MKIQMITDGASGASHGKPGGWAAILICPELKMRKELSGGEAETSNNRMELTAFIEGLKALKMPCEIELIADSEYVGLGVTERLSGWIACGWRGPQGKPVKNSDLWEQVHDLRGPHAIMFTHVDGHTGHVENEKADSLARAAKEAIKQAKSAPVLV